MECVYSNISSSSVVLADSSFIQHTGSIYARDGLNWTAGCQQCFTIWEASTKTIAGQGCWYDESSCLSNSCLSNGILGDGLEFCCCSGDGCNKLFQTGVVSTSDPSTPTTTQPSSLVWFSREEESVLTNILLGVLLGLLLTILLVIWRLCKTCRHTPKSLDISASRINLIPPPSPSPLYPSSTPLYPPSHSFYKQNCYTYSKPTKSTKLDFSRNPSGEARNLYSGVGGETGELYRYHNSFSAAAPLMMEGRGRSGAPHVSEERGRPGAPLVMEGRGQLGATAPSTKDNLVSEAAVKNLYARIHMHSFVARNKAAECARKLAVAQAKKVPRNLDHCV